MFSIFLRKQPKEYTEQRDYDNFSVFLSSYRNTNFSQSARVFCLGYFLKGLRLEWLNPLFIIFMIIKHSISISLESVKKKTEEKSLASLDKHWLNINGHKNKEYLQHREIALMLHQISQLHQVESVQIACSSLVGVT
jgi:hypothetical protein